MTRTYRFIFAAVVLSSAPLYAMEEKEPIIARKKREKATQGLADSFDSIERLPTFCGIDLYNRFERLLQEGADPNIEIFDKDLLLKTLSLYASEFEQKMVPPLLIPLLVKHGAEVDKKSGIDESNALHLAAKYANYKKAYMLLQCGADVNCANGALEKPLHMRRYHCGDRKFIKLLLIYGASPFIKNKDGNDVFISDVAIGLDVAQKPITHLGLHQKAQKLLQLKAQKEEEGAPLKEIQKLFSKAGFPYPHRGVVAGEMEGPSMLFLIPR